MKKQTNLTIKAHLIRGAFYLLLLTAVCAIPFALAQRNSTKRGVANPASKPSMVAKFAAGPARGAAQGTKLSGVRSKLLCKAPRSLTLALGGFFPMTFAVFRTCRVCSSVLKQPVALVERTYCRFRERRKLRRWCYTINMTTPRQTPPAQDFEAAFDPFDDQLADDFVVPGGQTWNVESIDADGIPFNCSGSCIPDSFNVRFYTDSAGLPGTQVYEALGQSFALVARPTPVYASAQQPFSQRGLTWVECEREWIYWQWAVWLDGPDRSGPTRVRRGKIRRWVRCLSHVDTKADLHTYCRRTRTRFTGSTGRQAAAERQVRPRRQRQRRPGHRAGV